MIQGLHAMFYTTDADATRAFIRDKLQWTGHDVGDGWLIFDTPESDLGCHPSEKRFHELSFYCTDLEGTVAELKERGVEFSSEISDAGFGMVINMEVPGAGTVTLYEPKYTKG
ncbi:MAG: VOC family protein [Planctomycetota bacterium]|jgi:catechol 2,3-dioxygenase-like lactoylglutathione lyase family enzyme